MSNISRSLHGSFRWDSSFPVSYSLTFSQGKGLLEWFCGKIKIKPSAQILPTYPSVQLEHLQIEPSAEWPLISYPPGLSLPPSLSSLFSPPYTLPPSSCKLFCIRVSLLPSDFWIQLSQRKCNVLSLDRAGFELLGSLLNCSCFCMLWEGWIEGPGFPFWDKHLTF